MPPRKMEEECVPCSQWEAEDISRNTSSAPMGARMASFEREVGGIGFNNAQDAGTRQRARLIKEKRESASYARNGIPASALLIANERIQPAILEKLEDEAQRTAAQERGERGESGDPLDLEVEYKKKYDSKGRLALYGSLDRSEKIAAQAIEHLILYIYTKNGKNLSYVQCGKGGPGAERLKLLARSKSGVDRYLQFFCAEVPAIHFRDYNRRLIKGTRPHFGTLMAALAYVGQFSSITGIQLDPYCVHRVWCVAFGIAFKFWEDGWIAGRFVASVAGIAPKEYAAMEITMIQALSWKLTVSDEGMGALKNIMARPMQDLERWRKNGMVDSRGYPCRAVAVPQDPAEVTLENARKRARRS